MMVFMKGEAKFQEEYQKLNTSQKEAVETLEGPVMVIAGPGTGKTQVLALRIANILRETDTPADGILCLTFTNSGVKAMRERLSSLIGPAASRVNILTFHSFASSLIEEFYGSLDLPAPPALLDERDSVLLADNLLETEEWEYLRPRSGGAHNFKDLKSLISFLKREGISPEQFEEEVKLEIERIKEDPENISSRGERKGALKKEAEDKIERFSRTIEAGRFYGLYEETKKEKNLVDYDDILKLAVDLVRTSSDARASVAERYLYVLVDEHQDSSGVQNKFLEYVWGEVEKPNLFVVGDDRQLIYGFGGASLSHFESFQENFQGTKLISLLDNYRSTQPILDLADAMLSSTLSKGKLKSHKKGTGGLRLVEAEVSRDEILYLGIELKGKLESGVLPHDCAVLVPKNSQVKSALAVLSDVGIPVATGGKTSFFSMGETASFLGVLKVLANPYDSVSISELLLQPHFNLPVLETHKFLHKHSRGLSLEKLAETDGKLRELGKILVELLESSNTYNIYELTQEVGKKVFFDQALGQQNLSRWIECVRTMLHLILSRMEKDPKISLRDFLLFIDRLEEYGEDLPVAVLSGNEGVRVMTLHASKGLEFEHVWVAHLDEKSLMSGKAPGFSLPEKLLEYSKKKDEETVRRELYVAITRAKSTCTLSYSASSYTGRDLSLSKVILDLPREVFEETSKEEVQKQISTHDPLAYVTRVETGAERSIEEVKALVKEHYEKSPVAVTHLNNFFSCPWKWYFRNFLRLPERESEFLIFGNLVHSMVEEVLILRTVDEEALKEKLEETLDDLRVYNPVVRKRFRREAMNALELFGKKFLPYISHEAVSEKKLNVQSAETPLTITGKIDLLEAQDEGLRVTDFKTGKLKKLSLIEKVTEEGRMSDLLRQLTMYSFLLENQRKPEKVSTSRLVFLEAGEKDKDAVFETEISIEEIKLLEKDILDYHQLLNDGSWVERDCDFKPNSFEKECPYCALKKNLFE